VSGWVGVWMRGKGRGVTVCGETMKKTKSWVLGMQEVFLGRTLVSVLGEKDEPHRPPRLPSRPLSHHTLPQRVLSSSARWRGGPHRATLQVGVQVAKELNAILATLAIAPKLRQTSRLDEGPNAPASPARLPKHSMRNHPLPCQHCALPQKNKRNIQMIGIR
jgi:hypothetical protein